MNNLFLTVLKMSITSSYVILFVLVIRMFLKKSPKIFSYVLWGIVLFRLICPISFESRISFIPKNSNIISKNSINVDNAVIDNNNYEVSNNTNSSNVYNDSLNSNSTTQIEVNNTSKMTITSIASTLWLLVILTMISYNLYSLIKLKSKLKGSKHIEDNIYESEHIETAFVIGIFEPRIYVPINLFESEKKYILAHEKIHIRRYDNIIKVISYLVLIIHWFNPLVWLSFILMSKDMEMSCDEAVVKIMGNGIKKEYSISLLSFATDKRGLGIAPIAFGEGDVKNRIKNVLKYKKPRFWITIISVIVVTIVGLGLMFNPVSSEENSEYLDINNVLEGIFNTDEVIVRKIGEGGYVWPGETFYQNFKKHIKGIEAHKVNSAYELSQDIVVYIYGNSEYSLSFYQSEPNLMKVSYGGEYKYYTSSNDMYSEVNLMLLSISDRVQDEIIVAVMDGKKTNKTSYEDRPVGVDYLELSIGNRKYFIYEDKGKYYVERPYVAIYKISEEVYENAKKFAVEPKRYKDNIIDEAFIEDLVCKTVEEQESGYTKEDILIIAPKIFGFYEEENKLKVFATVNISNYSLKDNIVEFESGGITPYAITYAKNDDGYYSLEEFLPSMDGSFWEPSIREFCTMPVSGKEIEGLADKIINHYMDYSDIIQLEREKLIQYLNDNNLKGISLLEKGYNEPDKFTPLTN